MEPNPSQRCWRQTCSSIITTAHEFSKLLNIPQHKIHLKSSNVSIQLWCNFSLCLWISEWQKWLMLHGNRIQKTKFRSVRGKSHTSRTCSKIFKAPERISTVWPKLYSVINGTITLHSKISDFDFSSVLGFLSWFASGEKSERSSDCLEASDASL
jgi:hypothetical protein